MKKIFPTFFFLVLTFVLITQSSSTVFAAYTTTQVPTFVSDLVNKITFYIINPLIILLFVIALLYFLWGMVVFIWKSDSQEERKKGVQSIFWGSIGMAIMIGVYGIIGLIANTISLFRF